ncbi:MAG: hypothetical protein H7Y38_11345 [Armatimonadetes bacterium]|nr:hypothetical protein [Armatimonadota bacterium]
MLFCLLALIFSLPIFSLPIARAYEKPKTVLVLVSGATLDDLHPGGRLPAVRELAEQGGVALLHNGVWGEYNENAAYLSVGASERMAAPATGDVSFKALSQFQPNVANRAMKVGAFGRALSDKTVVWENHRSTDAPGSLVLADTRLSAEGRTPKPDVRVVVTDSIADCDKTVRRLMARNRTGFPEIIVVSPSTSEIADGAPYRRLGFVAWLRINIRRDSLLVSPTTRTPGLVANVDIAPTVIENRGGKAIPGAVGQPVRSDALRFRNVWQTLSALDRQHNAAARATTPVLGSYGVFAGVACLFALWASGRDSAKAKELARFGLLTAASVLPALLPVGVLAPPTALWYGATLTAIAATTAGLATLAAARFPRTDALTLVFGLLVALLCADLLLPTRFVEASLLSASTLTGIRFYGIGNEWLGLLVGAAVAINAPWYVGVVVVCAAGLPFFGADAGGTLAATIAFSVLHFSKNAERLRKRHVAGAFALAVAVTLCFALLDRFLPNAARSHVGAAVATGQSANGFAALAAIATRKLALNAGLLLKPWTWLAAAAIGVVGWGLTKRLPATGETRSVLPAALCGAAVALLFNDGGVAAGLLLLVPVIVRRLYGDGDGTSPNETPATVLS